MDEENRERTDTQKKIDEENTEIIDAQNKNGESANSGTSATDTSAQSEQTVENSSGSERFNATGTHDENTKCCPELKVSDGMSVSQTVEDAKCPEHSENFGNVSENQGERPKEFDLQKVNLVKQKSSASEPIVIPIVLKMAEFDHKALLEEWISTRTFGDKCLTQDQDKLISNLKIIQDYLCSFEAQGLTIVNISATTFPQTLDWLHSHLLQCIEHGVSAATPKIGNPSKAE